MRKKIFDLEFLAKQAMLASGFQPEFPKNAMQQLKEIEKPASPPSQWQDLRSLLWCSIDNDDSRDLDQLTHAEQKTEGKMTLWVAVADVDSLVPKDTALDRHAQINTTSVYTPARIFPMLPEKLSTNLTSLNENEDRLAVVVRMAIDQQGEIEETEIFQAMVRNHAKLAYSSVGAWFEKKQEAPDKIKQVRGLQEALLCQLKVATLLKKRRHLLGALTLETQETQAQWMHEEVILALASHNLAHQLIEDFMIAANSAMARLFREAKIPSLRRVVRTPKRWDRIVEIAAELGEVLPQHPDPKALDAFLVKRKQTDPLTFADLSLTVIKLLGKGEYVVEVPGDTMIGHFGLALSEYTHSTAPNRRFPDLISQRLVKAHLRGKKSPYPLEELIALAQHCTQQEDGATKIQRRLTKSAAAVFLSSRIGDVFSGIITGAATKGTWVRIFDPPVEGKIVHTKKKLDVGDKVSVRLMSVDVPHGYIDFVAI